jgi:hypothetical protein
MMSAISITCLNMDRAWTDALGGLTAVGDDWHIGALTDGPLPARPILSISGVPSSAVWCQYRP